MTENSKQNQGERGSVRDSGRFEIAGVRDSESLLAKLTKSQHGVENFKTWFAHVPQTQVQAMFTRQEKRKRNKIYTGAVKVDLFQDDRSTPSG